MLIGRTKCATIAEAPTPRCTCIEFTEEVTDRAGQRNTSLAFCIVMGIPFSVTMAALHQNPTLMPV